MTATNQNFDMYSGETKNLVIPVTKDDGTSLDLTGATIKWAVRPSERNTTILLQKQAPDITIVSNQIQIALKPADTATMEGTYYHECKVTDSSGNASIVFTGQVAIEKTGI